MHKMAYASQTGTSHLLLKKECQDRVVGIEGLDGCCIVLADGAGSVPQSGEAAEVVTHAVGKTLTENFMYWYGLSDEDFATQMTAHCCDAVDKKNPDLKASCTLLAAAVSFEGKTILCHVGDGIVFGVLETGEIQVISQPENGDELNLTYFLSGPNANRHMRRYLDLPEGCTAVLLCSDGAGVSLWNVATGECAPAIRKMAEWMRTMDEKTVSELVSQYLDELFRNNTEDDMSIAIISIDS